MRGEGVAIQSLLMRTFVPAVTVMAIIMAMLVYGRVYATILDGFDRKLVITSTLTGALIDPVDHENLAAIARRGVQDTAVERSAEYLRNVQPMRKIRNQLQLTYLYTQVFGRTQDIAYILDSNIDKEHSSLGSEDNLPKGTLGDLRAAITAGRVHVSPIEYQQQWGLLKTATAPMRTSQGRIAAMAGADVNISVIRVATQNALFASALIGIISLVICTLVVLVIVSRVARPIERLKLEALRIATGDHARPDHLTGPREVTKLRDALFGISLKMRSKLLAAQEASARHEQKNARQLLEDALVSDGTSPVTLVDNDALLVIWLGSTEERLDQMLHRRAMIALARRIEQTPTLSVAWEMLADGAHGGILVLDRQALSLHLKGEAIVSIHVGGEDGTDVPMRPGQKITLTGNEDLCLTDGAIPLKWRPGA
jgi:hypothetical protein